MRQHENLPRFPVILDYWVIQYGREAPWYGASGIRGEYAIANVKSAPLD
jgi:hypothetical protein